MGEVYENIKKTIVWGFTNYNYTLIRKGNPYDNACIESFHSILKKEEIYGNTYQDFNQAKRAIFEYIELWYNRKRIHSAIGYLTPEQRENIEIMAA